MSALQAVRSTVGRIIGGHSRRWLRRGLEAVLIGAVVALGAVSSLAAQSDRQAAQPTAQAGAALEGTPQPDGGAVQGAIEGADNAAIGPERSDPLPTPDQRRAYLHVFIAFGVAWALILAYVVLLSRRIAEARRQFDRLRAG